MSNTKATETQHPDFIEKRAEINLAAKRASFIEAYARHAVEYALDATGREQPGEAVANFRAAFAKIAALLSDDAIVREAQCRSRK